MENKIIVDGIDLDICSFDWLMQQDLQFLHHWIASSFIMEQTSEGGGIVNRPNRCVKSIYVLLHVLDLLIQAKPKLEAAASETSEPREHKVVRLTKEEWRWIREKRAQ